MIGSLALDQAFLARHLMIFIYGDIQRFFPSMDRQFVLCAEAWYGLPVDVREATFSLYSNTCMMYETEHGLPDFDFTTLHMTCGYIQGCTLSTEKAKIFMNSLAEAIATVVGAEDGAFRFWGSGGTGGATTTPYTLCSDDLLGMVTTKRSINR